MRATVLQKKGLGLGEYEAICRISSQPTAVTSQRSADPNEFQLGGDGKIPLRPAHDPIKLKELVSKNNTLLQCVHIYADNIESHGYDLIYVGPAGKRNSMAAKKEKRRIDTFLSAINYDDSYTELRKKLRTDYETIGWMTIEVCRNSKGEIASCYYVEAHTIRQTARQTEPVRVKTYRKSDKGFETITERKYFRRYMQNIDKGQTIYFKEFGDPRRMSAKTGTYESKDFRIEDDDLATEIVFKTFHTVGESYGFPRWINQAPSVIGSREAEIVNYSFFQDNAIPAMAILVSGGVLSEETLNDLSASFNGSKGRDSFNKVLVIEAESVDNNTSIGEEGRGMAPRVDIKPMTNDRLRDGLFLDYDENCSRKIRGAFRLPPLYFGFTDDYTRATADKAVEITESHVFSPERETIDNIFNTRILLDEEGKPPFFWALKSKQPRLVGSEAILRGLPILNSMGAMTPNTAIKISKDWFGLDIQEVEAKWGNFPFQLLALLMNRADTSSSQLDEDLDARVDESLTDKAPEESEHKPTQANQEDTP